MGIQWIAESILHHSDYDGLCRFFENVRKQKHDYIAVMTRRCFNLNDAFLQIQKSLKNNTSADKRFMSDNALLLRAIEIADFYRENGHFPSILLVDDILLHGRGISKLLYSLEEIIVERLKEKNGESKDRFQIHFDLIGAVDMLVYAMNKQPLLVDDSYRWRIRCADTRYGNDLRELSQRISVFLKKAGIPNTSYVLSFKSPERDELRYKDLNEWRYVRWQYRGSTQDTFIKDTPDNFIPTIRISMDKTGPSTQATWTTSLVVFDEMSIDDLSDCCNDATDILKQISGIVKMHTILNENNIFLRKQRTQFLSTLLSMACFCDFCNEYGLNFKDRDLLECSDIEKIASNFIDKDELIEEFKMLWKDWSVLNNLKDKLYYSLANRVSPFSTFTIGKKADGVSQKSLNEASENIIYEKGIQSERAACEIGRNLKRFYPAKRGNEVICVNDYLVTLSEEMNRDIASRNLFSKSDQIACMLMFMDRGLMAMNLESNENTSNVQCILKPDELSAYLIPERFRLFMPALALVEQNCRRIDMEPKNAVNSFVAMLSEYDCPANERKLLKQLKGCICDFVNAIYNCGQSLDSWNINFYTTDCWQEEFQGTFLDFIIHENDRVMFYKEKAKKFLGYRF